MFANSQTGGVDIAPGDTCLTPPVPVPIPYVNIAQGSSAIPNVPNMFFIGGNAHNQNTIIPMTSGDEPGSAGGVCSGTVKGKSQQIKGSANFIIQGAPATRLSDPNLTNTTNIVGTRAVPSQTKILITT